MESSDEDIPLAQRNRSFMLGKSKPVVLSSDDDSPLPSWLENHKPAAKEGTTSMLESDSDSDIKEVISPVKLLSQSPAKPRPSGQSQDIEPKPAPQVARVAQPAAHKPTSQPKPKLKKTSPPKKPTAASAEQPSGAGPASRHDDDGAGPSQPAPPATGSGSGPRSVPSGLPVSTSTLPVVFPDKISQAKVLLELESNGEVHGATDLSGDSGAIGRVLVSGQPGAQQVQIDLKGVLYNATVVPCPVTMAVVNIGPSEAKVESFFSEFVQLREDARFSEAMGVDAIGNLLGEDDEDEHYGGGPGEDAGPAGGKKETRKKPAAKGRGGPAKKGGASAAKKPRGVKKGGSSKGKGKAKK